MAIQQIIINTFRIIESIGRILLLSKWNSTIKKRINGTHLIILANGPSLVSDIENHDLKSDSHLLCVNHFPTTNFFEELRPSYYVTAVPELWLEGVDNKYVQQRNALLDAFTNKTHWPLTMYLPHASRSNPVWESTLRKNSNITICYFNNVPIEGPDWFTFWSYRNNLGMPRPHNVLIPSIMIGLNMGYKSVDLLGVDHSWLPEISVNKKNQVLLSQKHFYDEHPPERRPMDMSGRGERNLSQVLHKFMHTFAAYHVLNSYALSLKATITNYTKGSFIDAFKRN